MAGVYTSGSGTIIIDITQTVASNRLYRGTQQSYTIDSSKKNDHMRLHGDGISMQEGGNSIRLAAIYEDCAFFS